MPFQRYAIYLTPPPGAFADAGAAWLGWDIATGTAVGSPDDVTKRPRKYGFHGTMKAPFRLAENQTEIALFAAFNAFCTDQNPIMIQGLSLARMGRFLALVPTGDASELAELSANTLRKLDIFRAPLTDDELARRRKSHLTAAQDAHLTKWGYPNVLDQFRFHMTLTGALKDDQLAPVTAQAMQHFAPVLPSPMSIGALTLVGEQADGMFKQIIRAPLGRET